MTQKIIFCFIESEGKMTWCTCHYQQNVNTLLKHLTIILYNQQRQHALCIDN